MIFIKNYIIGAYIRLSKEDINKKNYEQSESIINQRILIKDFLSRKGLLLHKEYIDDGYSGTSFDRPGFNEMIEDINNNKVNMIITKDLSRLGRDYIKCGYYLEDYFPSKGVRYISILDNIDTLVDSYGNDLVPFKALFNDMQSKDTSKKIRAILKNKKENGLFLGSSTSFGYKKDLNNKYRLLIDTPANLIVKYIFFLSLIGKNKKEICNYLNYYNVPTPIDYKLRINSHEWTSSSVYNILHNYMYTGSLVQGVQKKISYKSKKRVKVDKCNWIIVHDTHEPIISKKVFDIVNKSYTRKKLPLEGVIYCKDCGSLMSVKVDKRTNNIIYNLNCNNYSKNTKLKLCTSHFISYKKVEEYVINKLYIDKKSINDIKRIEVSKIKEINVYYFNNIKNTFRI